MASGGGVQEQGKQHWFNVPQLGLSYYNSHPLLNKCLVSSPLSPDWMSDKSTTFHQWKMGSIRWRIFYVQNLMMMGAGMLNEMCQGSSVRMHFLMHSSQMYEAEQVGNKSCLHLPHDWRHESVDPRSAERCTEMWAKYAANKHWTHSKTFEKPPHIHLSLHLAAEWKYDKS